MNQEEAKKWAELFQAIADGEQLQFYSQNKASWIDMTALTLTVGCWPAERYRVKPKPIELEVWYNPTPPSGFRVGYTGAAPETTYLQDKGYTKIKMRQVFD